jgi:4-diphosphocytidyl-2-C-methyl-D-erythritol kinase
LALLLRAHAKVNLGLRVLGRRADGYHELDTTFHGLQLHDDLVAETSEGGIQLQVAFGDGHPGSGNTGTPDPGSLDIGPANLVHRAATAFLAEIRAPDGARFFLRKRIPIGAGLGGGSSDAAAALHLLNQLHGAPLGSRELQGLAAGLGADVAFFLEGGTQRGRGRGEILTPLAHPSLHFLLFLPPLGTSTAEVYKNHPAQLICGGQQVSIPDDKAVPCKGLALPERLLNDLEGAAMGLYPELCELRAKIAAAGMTEPRMSGSGSTLYLVSETEQEMAEAETKFGFLERDGVRLLRTRSAEAPDLDARDEDARGDVSRGWERWRAREVPWPVGRGQVEQRGAE